MNTQTQSKLPTSILTKNQVKTFGPKFYREGGCDYRITAKVRYDDQCGNGHNSFGITAEIDRKERGSWRDDSCGCCHDEVAKHFPELAPFLKWHLTSSDGPMHYVANTEHWVSERNMKHARSTAVWPEATDEELCTLDLREVLLARLPALMAEFKTAMESLGFTY